MLWKGAITFGLVHIPIALYTAVDSQRVDFDWLDKRSMEPVGYKRINKVTGKEITSENIVKGIEYEDGHYVILSAEEIENAYPKTTQTIEIEAFVPLSEIPFLYFDKPYYIAPINKGAKVYALLREVLARTGRAGVAKVVIQTKQHLAVLVACGPALILNLIRWGDEVRPWSDLDLPEEGVKSTGLSAKELKMAEQLVGDMSVSWHPEDFTDSFKLQIMELVRQKAEAGEITAVAEAEEQAETGGARIYDLTEMLRRSLQKDRKGGSDDKAGKSEASPAGKARTKAAAEAKSVAAKKTASKRGAVKQAATVSKSVAGRSAVKKTAAKSVRKSAGRKAA